MAQAQLKTDLTGPNRVKIGRRVGEQQQWMCSSWCAPEPRGQHVAMLAMVVGVVLQVLVVLPAAPPAQATHATGEHDHSARFRAAGQPQIARAEQRHLSLHHAHRRR